MGFLDRIIQSSLTAKPVKKAMDSYLQQNVGDAITKAVSGRTPSLLATPTDTGRGVKRYQVDFQDQNQGLTNRQKPGGTVPFATLRRFSEVHEVSRMAINYRKRQVNGLKWDIVQEDEEDTVKYEKQIEEATAFFKTPAPRTKYRNWVNKIVEDLLVLDAVAIEKARTRGGDLLGLIPVDGSTIRLRVDNSGATPEPPEIAYKQVIRGQITAELTADEMIYDMMNPRSNTPYGLAPLESLILTVSSALRSSTYNLAYLTDGNIPEGLFAVPEGWQPAQIKEFQDNWDAMLAGDDAATRKLLFVPGGQGAGYTQTKKPEDMAFKDFNHWLMLVTAAMFEVPPTELGFQPQSGLGGKGVNEEQAKSGDRKGLFPIVQFLSEILTDVIQQDLGFTELRFKFQGFDDEYQQAKSDLNKSLIESGQRTINEQRTEDGLDPFDADEYPLADTPFILAGSTVVPLTTETEVEEPEEEPEEETDRGGDKPENQTPEPEDKPEERSETETEEDEAAPADPVAKSRGEVHIELVTDLRKLRKMTINRIKAGKSYRDFESSVLPQATVDEINKKLRPVTDVDEARSIIKGYMEDYQVNFLADVATLDQGLRGVLNDRS